MQFIARVRAERILGRELGGDLLGERRRQATFHVDLRELSAFELGIIAQFFRFACKVSAFGI